MRVGDGVAIGCGFLAFRIAYFIPIRHFVFGDGILDFFAFRVFGKPAPGIGPSVAITFIDIEFGFVGAFRHSVERQGEFFGPLAVLVVGVIPFLGYRDSGLSGIMLVGDGNRDNAGFLIECGIADFAFIAGWYLNLFNGIFDFFAIGVHRHIVKRRRPLVRGFILGFFGGFGAGVVLAGLLLVSPGAHGHSFVLVIISQQFDLNAVGALAVLVVGVIPNLLNGDRRRLHVGDGESVAIFGFFWFIHFANVTFDLDLVNCVQAFINLRDLDDFRPNVRAAFPGCFVRPGVRLSRGHIVRGGFLYSVLGGQLNFSKGFAGGIKHFDQNTLGTAFTFAVFPDLGDLNVHGRGLVGVGDGVAIGSSILAFRIAYFIPIRLLSFGDGILDCFAVYIILGKSGPSIGPGVTIFTDCDFRRIRIFGLLILRRLRLGWGRCSLIGVVCAIVITFNFLAVCIEGQIKGFGPNRILVAVVIPDLIDGDVGGLVVVGVYHLIKLVGSFDRTAGLAAKFEFSRIILKVTRKLVLVRRRKLLSFHIRVDYV